MGETLFELEETATCNRCGAPAKKRREHADVCTDCNELVHALLPNMSYACYENILSVHGHFEMGTSAFDKVTCPECRAEGVEKIRVRMRRQIGKCIECGGDLRKDVCLGCGVAQ